MVRGITLRRRLSTDHMLVGVNYLLLAVFGTLCLLPLLHLLAISFSSSHAVMSGYVSVWPVDWTADAYHALTKGNRVMKALFNNVLITIVGIALSMLFTMLAAYPLSRTHFYARRALTLAIVFTMLFSGGMIPNYLVVKSLGLIDSYAALWLPVLISPFNMLIMKSFFEQLPKALDEAARIDGSGEMGYLCRIALPLTLPMLATLSLFYGVNYWNMFMNVLLYINDSDKYNLTVFVQNMVNNQQLITELQFIDSEIGMKMIPETLQAAAVMILIVPLIVVYPFIQKYFVKGVMIGAIKG